MVKRGKSMDCHPDYGKDNFDQILTLQEFIEYSKEEEKKKVVYGVYEGCVWEGGGVKAPMYFSRERAIQVAEELVETRNKEHEEFDHEDKEWIASLTFKKVSDTRWSNNSDEIVVQEFEIE